MRRVITPFAAVCFSFTLFAQLDISGEWRPRTEFRNGYTTLSNPGEKGVLITTQRTRLNFRYTDKNNIESYFSFQDIRTWGEFDLNSSNSNLSLYEGWVQLPIGEKLRLRFGRQEFEYDDLKILSNSDWRLQGRSHDALHLNYLSSDSTFKLHVAGAINNKDQVLVPTAFQAGENYKNMSMFWMNKKLTQGEISLLLLNLGQQSSDSTIDINYLTTVGTYANYRIAGLYLTGSFYVQKGTNELSQGVQASMASLSVQIPITSSFSVTPGFDLLSGTSAEKQLDANNTSTNTFIPLYARRHRYFGIQDMFYFAGFVPPSGLHDYFVKLEYKLNKKWKYRLQTHSFYSAASILDGSTNTAIDSRDLGIESDLLIDFQPTDELKVSLGYAHFFATENMRILKQRGNENEVAQFAFLALTYKPTFLKL